MILHRIMIKSLLVSSMLCSTAVIADTLTGQINTAIELTNACEINGNTGTNNLNFGNIAFGQVSALFKQLDSEVAGSAQSGVSIRCSPGQGATLTVSGGSHDSQVSSYPFAMQGSGSKGTQYVPYRLYTDSGRSKELKSGDKIKIAADGIAKSVPIYARAYGVEGLAAGTYRDTLQISLDF